MKFYQTTVIEHWRIVDVRLNDNNAKHAIEDFVHCLHGEMVTTEFYVTENCIGYISRVTHTFISFATVRFD